MEKQLPNKEAAVVEDKKIKEYLLNKAHPAGAGKAKFFLSKGFNLGTISWFRSMLIAHGIDNPVVKIETNPFTTKYIIEGPAYNYYTVIPHESKWGLMGYTYQPTKFNLRTVWSIENGTNIPKLVTAYPI